MSIFLLTDEHECTAVHCGIVCLAMQRTEDQNANGVTSQVRQRKISNSRKFHESRKIEPTNMARPIQRNMNGSAKHEFTNGQAKTTSRTSLEPRIYEAATLLGSVGSMNAAEANERLRRGSTSCEEAVYQGFPFPFENLVFEGGGNKGMAYVGALQVRSFDLFCSLTLLWQFTSQTPLRFIMNSYAVVCLHYSEVSKCRWLLSWSFLSGFFFQLSLKLCFFVSAGWFYFCNN